MLVLAHTKRSHVAATDRMRFVHDHKVHDRDLAAHMQARGGDTGWQRTLKYQWNTSVHSLLANAGCGARLPVAPTAPPATSYRHSLTRLGLHVKTSHDGDECAVCF